MQSLARRLQADTGIFGDQGANHVLLNAYLPGQGILPHEARLVCTSRSAAVLTECADLCCPLSGRAALPPWSLHTVARSARCAPLPEEGCRRCAKQTRLHPVLC